MNPKMDQDKLLYVIIAVLAVMLIAYLAFARAGESLPTFLGGSGKPFSLEAEPGAEEEADEPAATEEGATTTTPKALTYETAVELYGGYRFQFVSCHGNPGSMTLKVGKKFLLDNRDPRAHTIVIGKLTYKLGANGFAVATAPTVAGTYNITCDGGGAATLKVQS